MLVLDGPRPVAAPPTQREALLACMQASWEVTRAVANAALIERVGGLIVTLARRRRAPASTPRRRGRAWRTSRARCRSSGRGYATRAVCVAPGDATTAEQLAELVCLAGLARGLLFLGLPAGPARRLTGSGFATGAGTTFSFGKGAATSVNCASSMECTLPAPAAAKPGAVDVRAKAGGKTSKKNPPGDRFTYTG